MQAHDQDELRRQAQRVLTRRIGTDAPSTEQTTPEPERPRRRPDAPARPREFQTPTRPREFDRGTTEAEVTETQTVEPPILETTAPPARAREPIARATRRPAATRSAPPVGRSAYDLEAPQHSEIYNLLHSRTSLRQALIVNEILGKPKALRESTDPEHFGSM